MRHVILDYKSGEVELVDVPVPLVHSGGALVHNVCSVASVGPEALMINMAKKSLLGKARDRPDLIRQDTDIPMAYRPMSQVSDSYGESRRWTRLGQPQSQRS